MKKHTGPTVAEVQARSAAMLKELPAKVSNKARNFFVGSFRLQGFNGSAGIERWAKRKNDKQPGRSVLVKTGALRRSLFASHTPTSARVEVNGPAKAYAAAHNNGYNGTVNVAAHNRKSTKRFSIGPRKRYKATGETHAVRAHNRKANIPQRKFIGNSDVLNRQLLQMINSDIRKIFN